MRVCYNTGVHMALDNMRTAILPKHRAMQRHAGCLHSRVEQPQISEYPAGPYLSWQEEAPGVPSTCSLQLF